LFPEGTVYVLHQGLPATENPHKQDQGKKKGNHGKFFLIKELYLLTSLSIP